MALHLHFSWLLSLTYSLLYDDIVHNNTLFTLLTHRHMNICMHRNRQCKSALATAVPRGSEKPPRKQQGHTQQQERRFSDGNINRLNHKTIADFCWVWYEYNRRHFIENTTSWRINDSWELINPSHSYFSTSTPQKCYFYQADKKRPAWKCSALKCYNPDSAQLGLNQIVLVQVHPEDSSSSRPTKLPLFQTKKALWAPPTVLNFSIPKTDLRKKKVCKRLLMLGISVEHWNSFHPNLSASCLLPAHNKPNLFTAHRKQTGLSAGLEIINLINSPAVKPIGVGISFKLILY